MTKANGRSTVWPIVTCTIAILSFIPWIIDMVGFELVGLDMSNPIVNYFMLTWLPTLGNVLIVGTVIGWFGAPAISNMLKTRKQTIEHDIDEASRIKLQAESDYQEAENKLGALNDEIKSLRASYVQSIADEKENIAAETVREEARIENDANTIFELQTNVATRNFEREVMLKALDKAREDIINKVNTDSALRDRLIDQGIASLNLN